MRSVAKAIFLLALLLAGLAKADQVLQYEPYVNEVSGEVVKARFQHLNGNWYDFWFLRLNTPAAIEAEEKDHSFYGTFGSIQEIQLYADDRELRDTLDSRTGSEVCVKGTIFPEHTVWHRRTLVMRVLEINWCQSGSREDIAKQVPQEHTKLASSSPMQDLIIGLEAYNREDYTAALNTWLPLAEQGIAISQTLIGGMYSEGEGVSQDYVEAVTWYRKAAEQGFTIAQNSLGDSYRLGRGVLQDYAEAARWYKKAAEQGHGSAQLSLGNMYHSGNGVPRDFMEAVKWYKKAAEHGETLAQYNLGIIYLRGEGVPQDYVKAHKWANLAAVQGLAEAVKLRDTVSIRMTPAQIAEAQKLAREWAANHGQ